MRRPKFLHVLLLVLLLLSITAGAALAQQKTLYWENYDVEIFIQLDGSFRVVETQQLVFTSGTFTFGNRNIPTANVTGIRDVAVSEAGGIVYRQSGSDQPFTFRTYSAGGDFNIRYTFPETANDERTIVLEYTVDGGLLYYPAGDQLVWQAVPSNASVPIQHASVTVYLPEGAMLDNWDATGAASGAVTVSDDKSSVRFEAGAPMRGGPNFAVRVQWPSGIVAGAPAPWQQSVDAAEAYDQTTKPLVNTGILSLSLLILVAGPLGLYLIWYNKGRDYPVSLPAEWIPEPPSDLPPGMAGTLVDERAENKDVIATLVDLARRGVMSIQEVKSKGLLGIGEKFDYIYRLEDASLPMRPYERTLVNKLFGSAKEKKLSDLKEKFYSHVSQAQSDLYKATVDEALFEKSPERVRTTWGALGVVVLIGSFILGCVLTAALSQYSEFAICIPLALGVPALGLVVLARFMPRKTRKGAEEAAKWLAFKRFMEKIDKYTDVAEAKELFDRYLPYAIAFGLEDSWIARFARVDTAPPPWYYPGPYLGPRPRRYDWWGPADAGGGGGMIPMGDRPSLGEGAPPSMSDMSRGMGQSLSNMSAGLGQMLNSSAAALTSRPAPQSGGGSWSRGGGSWSGGGGFSGGGWSGGGGFSGGGGGGSSFG